MPTTVPTRPHDLQERRGTTRFSRTKRSIYGFAMDTNLDTLERVSIYLQFVLVLALAAYSGRVIVTPPPYGLSHNTLFFPVWTWCLLLSAGAVYQMKGWSDTNVCVSRNGALISLIVMLGLISPLYANGPGLATFNLATVALQMLVTLRLWAICLKNKRRASSCS